MAKQVITLMFHRVDDEPLGFHPNQLAEYFKYLKQHFPIVIPGQPLSEKLSVCLTFDDAYFDFYYHVYPLLKKYQMKAILGVPVKFIPDKSHLDPTHRLKASMVQMNDPAFMKKDPYCTWEELQEMAASDQVIIASHGYEHADLTQKSANHEQELVLSKQELERRLNIPIRHFVYPFGRFNRHIQQKVSAHYDYGIRIGSAINQGWESQRIIYRINAEKFWPHVRPFNPWYIRKISLKYWGNRLRQK